MAHTEDVDRMNYEQIENALQRFRLDSTLSALRTAVEEEAAALVKQSPNMFALRDGGRKARDTAKEYYAADINAELLDKPTLLTPMRILGMRRLPVAWAVAQQIMRAIRGRRTDE